MRRVLVTGFEPFGGETTNPSWEAVKSLPDTIDGAGLDLLQVPVTFGVSGDMVVARMRETSPDIVICVGQAAGRCGITVERVAIDMSPADEPVVDGGPAAYLATLPIKDCVEASRAAGVPCSVSNSAGTYVCNQLMYRVLHEQAVSGLGVMGGFVHVPLSSSQALTRPQTPSMSLGAMRAGLEAIVSTCVRSC
jgi:pyroglutamyl-peptidase